MSLFSNAIQRGTRAAQPAATAVIVGTLYYITDEGIIERSTGTVWQSFGGIQIAIVTLTNAQILTGNTVPVQIIAAPGAGFAIAPLEWFLCSNFSAGAYGVAFIPDLDINTTKIMTNQATWQAAEDRIHYETFFFFKGLRTAFENQALNYKQTADTTGGNAANQLSIRVLYTIQPVLA